MTLVSVIVPCYNAQSWISETLRSILEQDLVEIEIIVIDDGSTDASAEIVQREFPNVRLVRTSNGGPSKARNLGTKLARGEFLQYLDADDLLVPGKLKRQITLLNQSGADIAYGDWQRIELNEGKWHLSNNTVVRQLEIDPEIALFTDFWCPPAVYLFRRSIVKRVGGWNEGLPVIQDARFALDCALHGGRFIYCSGPAAYYRAHTSNSVSTRSLLLFWRDCCHNAIEVEAWWQSHGGITVPRRNALIQVYGNVAHIGFDLELALFERGYRAVQRLKGTQAPVHLRRLNILTKTIGYERARSLIKHARTLRRQMRQKYQRITGKFEDQ